jgi:hypothetical protein
MLRGASLAPLVKATQLTTLELDASDLIDEKALLKVKTLRALQVINLLPSSARFDDVLKVLLALATRGVVITGVDAVAHWLVEQTRFADALKLYDGLVQGGPWVSPSTYSGALFTVQQSNNRLPLDRRRAERYLAAGLPLGSREPSIFYNAACVCVETGRHRPGPQLPALGPHTWLPQGEGDEGRHHLRFAARGPAVRGDLSPLTTVSAGRTVCGLRRVFR